MLTGDITWGDITTVAAIVAAAFAVWWRIESRADQVGDDAEKSANTAHAAASLALTQLAEYKTHVAETYITKAGLREFRDDVMTGVRDVKGSVSTLHERMDRFIEGDKMTRKRQQGLSIETYARLLVCMPKKLFVSAVIDGNS